MMVAITNNKKRTTFVMQQFSAALHHRNYNKKRRRDANNSVKRVGLKKPPQRTPLLSKARPKHGCEGFLVVFRATFFRLSSGFLHQFAQPLRTSCSKMKNKMVLDEQKHYTLIEGLSLDIYFWLDCFPHLFDQRPCSVGGQLNPKQRMEKTGGNLAINRAFVI